MRRQPQRHRSQDDELPSSSNQTKHKPQEQGHRDSEQPAYSKIVTAATRTEAATKCAAEIWKLCDTDIKVVSCYIGKPGSKSEAANRMQPVQIRR